MVENVISQYLLEYADTDTSLVSSLPLPPHVFSFGLAVPLKGESLDDVERLLESLERSAQASRQPVLVAAVLNGSSSESPELVSNNSALLRRAQERSSFSHAHFFLERFSSCMSVLWVDRIQHRPFLKKEGVGLARKVGADLILQLHANKTIQSSWIWTTDADATIPRDYFDTEGIPKKAVAFHYKYRHVTQGFIGVEALTLYEIHLRYYFLGLSFAGSPFAFPTIGSCLAIGALPYATVRGFPNRSAGEDFHLLNKLRKVGPIHYRRQGEPLSLQGRFSKRVPFGTGQATQDIFTDLDSGKPYRLYHPSCFVFLRTLLSKTEDFLRSEQETIDGFLSEISNLLPRGAKTLEALNFNQILSEALRRKTVPNKIRCFHTAFDALKTLRFVHLMDEILSEFPVWRDALRFSPFLRGVPLETSAREVLRHLQVLEEAPASFNDESSELF